MRISDWSSDVCSSDLIPLNFPSLAAVLPQIRAGNLRALGISSAERSSAAPDIPAIGETVEGYEASSWYGMVTQADTPQAVIDKLHRSEERRVGKECVSTCRSRWSPDH